ncbi:MAG: hypothetical protein EPO08_20820 [Rhodospirillaceae bacterium]|nr:MAG: hypothetical protein EPO08_20820 [Rhodospirillaceae bacterium]
MKIHILGDFWRDVKIARKESKEKNTQIALAKLEASGLPYQQFSEEHYRVGGVDFWPSTGKWIEKGGRQGRGIDGLLKYIKNRIAAA